MSFYIFFWIVHKCQQIIADRPMPYIEHQAIGNQDLIGQSFHLIALCGYHSLQRKRIKVFILFKSIPASKHTRFVNTFLYIQMLDT